MTVAFITFDTFTFAVGAWLLLNLFGLILWVALCTFLEDNSECDELPPFEQCRHVRVIREDEHV